MKTPREAIERLLVLAEIAEAEERPEVEEADRLAIACVRKWLRPRTKNSCCKNEKRDYNGGCVSCGAPCL